MKLARRAVRTVRDQRGLLRIFEKGASLPFALKRCFVISHVPKDRVRAEHVVPCDIFLTALTGTCRLTLRTARRETATVLSHRRDGVAVPKGTWLRLDRFSTDAIVLVCASQRYRSSRRPRAGRG
jgi:hypothetical protein